MARNFYFQSDAKLGRLQADAYKRATQEARSFVPTAGDIPFREVLERLDQMIAIGRRELAARRVGPNDIEAWDTSFRVMFLLLAWRPYSRFF